MEYNIEKISNKIKNKRVTKNIFKYIILTILMILFIFNLILSFEENTHVFGIYMFNIVSESMKPTLQKDDLVIVQKCEPSELQIGNIITYKQDEKVISHRIIEKIEDRGNIKFKTKGDNNSIPDSEQVEAGKVYGKVLYNIGGVGKIVSYIQNVRGFINIVIFAIIVYILVSLRDKQKNTRKMKRKKYEIKKMRDNYQL